MDCDMHPCVYWAQHHCLFLFGARFALGSFLLMWSNKYALIILFFYISISFILQKYNYKVYNSVNTKNNL